MATEIKLVSLDAAVKECMKETGLGKAEAIHLLGLRAGNLRTVRGATYTVGSSKGGFTVAKESVPELVHLFGELVGISQQLGLRYTPGKLSCDASGSRSLADGLRGVAPLRPKPVKVATPEAKTA